MAVDLAVFDLDGTLLRGRTVCEILAGPIGRLEEMQAIERITDRDEMTAARVAMAEWYVDLERDLVLEWLDGAELAPGAVEGCERLRTAGVRLAIASITWEFAVARFAALFGADRWIGTTLESDGSVGHCWAETKAEWVCGLGDRSRIAAVGDTSGDVPMLSVVGLPIFVGGERPAELLTRAVHLPHADIRDVAEVILSS